MHYCSFFVHSFVHSLIHSLLITKRCTYYIGITLPAFKYCRNIHINTTITATAIIACPAFHISGIKCPNDSLKILRLLKTRNAAMTTSTTIRIITTTATTMGKSTLRHQLNNARIFPQQTVDPIKWTIVIRDSHHSLSRPLRSLQEWI